MTFKELQLTCWKRRPMPSPAIIHKMLTMTKEETEEWFDKNMPPVREWWLEPISDKEEITYSDSIMSGLLEKLDF